MSISFESALSSAIKLEPFSEKDAQQKAEEAAASAFASVLAQAEAASDVTQISGQRSNAVIPAALINLSASDPAGAETAAVINAADQAVDASDARETFLDFARKTPAEKMRAMILAEMGLSEDALRSLDADARAELEAKIRIRIEAKIREEMEKGSGIKLGQTALNPAIAG